MKDALLALSTKCCGAGPGWERGGNQEVFSYVVTLELSFKVQHNLIKEGIRDLDGHTGQRDKLDPWSWLRHMREATN